jgi:dihydroorotate dehydrogenase (fumarate)
MANLQTSYLGLLLKNPIIVSSCGLTGNIQKLVEIEQAGAGAVVLKSLFEEQITAESNKLLADSDHTEANDLINNYVRDNNLDNYLTLIKSAKQKLTIPVIASINCYTANEWISFAKKIEEAGADALELNIYYLPIDKNEEAEYFEKLYISIVEKLKALIRIPVTIKLSNQFTNILRLVYKLQNAGANGVVMFNRLYEPDIDIKSLEIKAAEVFSTPSDIRHTLRWVGLVSSQITQIDISASTGIHSAEGVIKQLLAGAKTVQICSVLYKKGIPELSKIIKEVEEWMKNQKYTDIKSFRGKLNYAHINSPEVYERSQFMKYYSSID